jgi:hypothetical protein
MSCPDEPVQACEWFPLELDILEALGGRLSLMADFGDELLRVG